MFGGNIHFPSEKTQNSVPAALKDLYTPAFLEEVAGAFHAVHPAFRPAAFLEAALSPPWEALELKQRMGRIAEVLHEALALPFPQAQGQLPARRK
jgi:hypothetical protein